MTVRVYTRQARAARLDGKPIACAATIRAEAAVKAGRLIWPFGITAAIVHPKLAAVTHKGEAAAVKVLAAT